MGVTMSSEAYESRPDSDAPAVSIPTVLIEQRGRLGVITLNRPRALNAITHEMVKRIRLALDGWASDDRVEAILLVSASARALSAGGDVVSLYRDAREGDGRASAAFWRDEYALNAFIAHYPKPYIAIMRGLVLGGGVGISAHGSHRIVTDDSAIGMPETSIGFVPDVGGTWLLSRGPGELGTHLALTGMTATAADAIAAGLADAYLPMAELPAFLRALETVPPDDAIRQFAATTPDSRLGVDRQWIDADYGFDTVAQILEALRRRGIPAAQAAADRIAEKSPLALTVTLAALRRARFLPTLETALEQEFRVSRHALTTSDFAEGIRAQLIDKDRAPRWNPATLAEITPGQVAQFFAERPPSDVAAIATP